MGNYQVEYGKIGAILAVVAVVAVAGYVLIGDDDPVISGEEDSLQLSIQQDEVQPGDTVRIEAHDADGNPVEGVEITANSERVGTTNVNGIQGYSIPEDAETLEIHAEHNGDTATITATVEDGEYNVEDSTDDDTDETDEDTNGVDEDDEKDETDDEDDITDEDDGEHGLQLENDPEAGELNTLTVYENGDPVEDETVTLNGEQLDDTTTTSGSLTFTVPDTEEITIEAADFEETYTVEGYTENGDDTDDDDVDPEALNADYNFDPSSPAEFVEVNFDASPSTGTNIQSYSWSSPDTTLDENTGEEITHEFEEPGTYTIELEIDGGDQGTDTQTGQITVDEAPEPDINFRTPTDGSEHEETTITYDFTVYNAVEGAEYRVIAGGNTIQTALLNEGQNDFEEEITVPEGEFNTLIQVDQAGETFTSNTHTVTSGLVDSEPEFVLNSPDGETIETFDQQTDVEFSYTVEERGWAEEASIVLEDEEGNEIDSHTHSIDSGETYNYEFENIPASEDGETYTWILELTDEGQKTDKSAEFTTEKTEPEYLVNQETPEDGQTVTDSYDSILIETYYETDTYGELQIEVEAAEDGSHTWQVCDEEGGEEGGEEDEGPCEDQTVSHNEGDTVHTDSTTILKGQERTHETSIILVVAMEYRWQAQIINEDGDTVEQTGYSYFETQNQPEDEEPEE